MNIAQIENTNILRSIKGTLEWAIENLGGTWVDSGNLTPGIGWTLVDGEFRYPSPFPSWVWEDGAWVAPVPEPEPVDGFVWVWDEDAGDWQQVEVSERP
jgi:hypothetical protein